MNQTIDSSKFALLCFCVTKDEPIRGHVRHSSASECPARRSQNFLRTLVRDLGITSRRHPVPSRPRLTHLLRTTNSKMFTPLRTGPMTEPSPRLRRLQTQYRAKVQNKSCLRVVNAMVLFPSLSGIASFAKVGLEYDHAPYNTDHPFDATR